MSKGSRQRKRQVSRKQFETNWTKVFKHPWKDGTSLKVSFGVKADGTAWARLGDKQVEMKDGVPFIQISKTR